MMEGSVAPLSLSARTTRQTLRMSVFEAAERVGIALILVHALSEEEKRFYMRFGFRESRLDPMTLLARTKDVTDAVQVGNA